MGRKRCSNKIWFLIAQHITIYAILFLAVKAVLATNCAIPGCHSLPSPQNGLDFADDCTIVSQGLRIKARAVDAIPSQMPPSGPPLSTADKQKIIDWLNAGGKHNN